MDLGTSLWCLAQYIGANAGDELDALQCSLGGDRVLAAFFMG